MITEVDLIDIGGGNRRSVTRLLERCGVIIHNVGPENPPNGSRPMVLPGVGSFGAVMEHLRNSSLDLAIRQQVLSGTPYLGICVGLQVLFDSSDESPSVPGLGLIPGKVVRYSQGKVPQIGWNQIDCPSDCSWESGYVYFVNSYFAQPTSPDTVLYEANYFEPFCAAISIGNVVGFQFHPEKSGGFEQRLMMRWLSSV